MNQRASLAAYQSSIAAAQKIMIVRSERAVQIQVVGASGQLTRRIRLGSSTR